MFPCSRAYLYLVYKYIDLQNADISCQIIWLVSPVSLEQMD